MKISKNTTNKRKKIFIIVLLLTLLASVVLVYIFLIRPKTESATTRTDTRSSDEQQAENLTKDPENKQASPNTDTPAPIETNDQADTGTVQMTATADVSGASVYIRGGINNAVVSEGVCYAQLTGPNGKTLRKDTVLLQNPSTTDCKTISIDVNELSPGAWVVKLHYTSANLKGMSNETSFEIR